MKIERGNLLKTTLPGLSAKITSVYNYKSHSFPLAWITAQKLPRVTLADLIRPYGVRPRGRSNVHAFTHLPAYAATTALETISTRSGTIPRALGSGTLTTYRGFDYRKTNIDHTA